MGHLKSCGFSYELSRLKPNPRSIMDAIPLALFRCLSFLPPATKAD